MTPTERLIWRRLRMRQVLGARFRRQCPIGPYIADFACIERGLVVELDGGQHAASSSDAIRDARIRAMGFRVIRFWNHEASGDPDAVVEAIAVALAG